MKTDHPPANRPVIVDSEIVDAMNEWARDDWGFCVVSCASERTRRAVAWAMAYYRLRAKSAGRSSSELLVLDGAPAPHTIVRPRSSYRLVLVHELDRMSDKAQDDLAGLVGLTDRRRPTLDVIYTASNHDLCGPCSTFDSYLGVDVPVIEVRDIPRGLVELSYNLILSSTDEPDVVCGPLSDVMAPITTQPAPGLWAGWPTAS